MRFIPSRVYAFLDLQESHAPPFLRLLPPLPGAEAPEWGGCFYSKKKLLASPSGELPASARRRTACVLDADCRAGGDGGAVCCTDAGVAGCRCSAAFGGPACDSVPGSVGRWQANHRRLRGERGATGTRNPLMDGGGGGDPHYHPSLTVRNFMGLCSPRCHPCHKRFFFLASQAGGFIFLEALLGL